MSDIEMLLKEQNDEIQDLKVFIAEKMAVIMDRLDKLEKEVREIKGPGIVLTNPSTSPNWPQNPTITWDQPKPAVDWNRVTCDLKSEVSANESEWKDN